MCLLLDLSKAEPCICVQPPEVEHRAVSHGRSPSERLLAASLLISNHGRVPMDANVPPMDANEQCCVQGGVERIVEV